MIEKIKGALFGLAVGDALGVPVEFESRNYLAMNPVNDMIGFRVWNQPAGTWSDDTSLAFCLAESLTDGYDLKRTAGYFIAWKHSGYWGAHHKVFDIGNTTAVSISRLMKGGDPTLAGGFSEGDNGNGSLMRILPLLFHIADLRIEERFQKTKDVSSLTHGHFRSVFACFIYLEMALCLLTSTDKLKAYTSMKKKVNDFIRQQEFSDHEIKLFDRILLNNIGEFPESLINSGGYVMNTIEAALWCVLASDNYKDTVLKAVNLGGDTDTTACVAGGLAGLIYGFDAIPDNWLTTLARFDDINDLCKRLNSGLK